MTRNQGYLWLASWVLCGCAFDANDSADTVLASNAEHVGQLSAAMQDRPRFGCSASAEWRQTCSSKGDYATCDGGQAMCCKYERDKWGNIKPFSYTCYANPSEIPRLALPGGDVGLGMDELAPLERAPRSGNAAARE
jgi:hypothetical protein